MEEHPDMSERLTRGFRRLFEVRVLHHYWLDDGAKLFDNILEPQRTVRLLDYDVRSFMEITPTPSTQWMMTGLQCMFRATALGLVVAVPSTAPIPGDAVFEFMVTVQDAAFYNYSALTLMTQRVHSLYDAPSDRMIRFKENVAVYSNLTGGVTWI